MRGNVQQGVLHKMTPNRRGQSAAHNPVKAGVIVVANPHRSYKIRRISDKPRVLIITGCTGFTRSRSTDSRALTGTLGDNVFQHTRQICGTFGTDNLPPFRNNFMNDISVAVENFCNCDVRNVYAAVGKSSVSTGEFKWRDTACKSSESHGKISVVGIAFKHERRNSHLLRVENRLVNAESLSNFDCRDVHRKSCNRPQRHVAAETSTVILRLPTVNINRAVLNDGIGRVTAFKPRDKYERFKRRAGLTFRHSRAVELICTASSDHCADISRLRLNGDDCSLRLNISAGVRVIFGQINHQRFFRHALNI